MYKRMGALLLCALLLFSCGAAAAGAQEDGAAGLLQASPVAEAVPEDGMLPADPPAAAPSGSPADTPAQTPAATPGAAPDAVPTADPSAEPGPEATPTALPAPGESPAQTPEAETTPGPAPTPGPEASAAPSPQSTPAPTAVPAPAAPQATPTPAAAQSTPVPATPSASPSASPQPTPAPELHAEAEAVQAALADADFSLLAGVSVYDEYGESVPFRVADAGGFDIHKPGSYTIVYAAEHPRTEETYRFKRSVSVYRTEEQEGCTLEFVLPALTLRAGDEIPPLHEDVYAVDETGTRVELSLAAAPSLDASVPGEHSLRYTALHPKSGERFTGERKIRILSAEDYDAYRRSQRPPSGTSSERYSRYLSYRNEIAEELQGHMEALTAALAARIQALSRAFPQAEVELYRALPLFLDDSGMAADAQTLRSAYPVDGAGMERMERLELANWSDMLSVFVARSALDVEEPLDLVNLRRIPLDGLEEVFYAMTDISYHEQDGKLRVLLLERTAEEAAEDYGFDDAQLSMLNELLQPEFQKVFASLTGDEAFAELDEAEREKIRASLPANLDLEREKVVVTAHSLVGKLSYFWGGKYDALGWNPLWGIPRRVTSPNSPTTGTLRPYGLDCSGFVAWVFINAAGDTDVLAAIGSGSAKQWSRSVSLGWDEAQPGDLAFRAVPGSVRVNHVGIVTGKEADGSYLVAHCSSSRNAVVVTEAWESGFRYFRRPLLYDSMEVGE